MFSKIHALPVFLAALLCGVSVSAQAQTNLVFDTSGNIVGNYVGPSSKAADWWYSSGKVAAVAADGVTVASTGAVLVKDISVPVSVVANVSKARIVAGAISCVSVVGAIGCAYTAAQVASQLKSMGLGYGPCPVGSPDQYAFICKPASIELWRYPSNGPYPAGTANSDANACIAYEGSEAAFGWVFDKVVVDINNSHNCWAKQNGGPSIYRTPVTLISTVPGPMAAPNPDVLTTDLTTHLGAVPADGPPLWGAGHDDQGRSPRDYAPYSPTDGTTPVTVTANPVTGPQVTTGTQTVPHGDGSNDVITTKQQTTVTPQTTGTTHDTSVTTFPTTTTTTITTINSVTNNTSTTTNVTNEAKPVSSAPLQLPTDYNREETQKKIETDLNTDSAPTMPDQKKPVDDAVTQSMRDMTQIIAETKLGQADKTAWFSWVWSPPTASCTPFAGTVHGWAISWDVCPIINNIRDVLNWLFALYGAIEIYGQLFRGRNA